MSILRKLFAIAVVGFMLKTLSPAQSPDSFQGAKRVVQALDIIQKESTSRAGVPFKKMVFTESEMNSYIAFRIASEKEDVMKELRLKLFNGNRVEGLIFIDLTDQKLPPLLKSRMNLYFEGNFEIQNGYIRLNFRKLFLEERQVPPMLLDLIIYVAAKLGKTEVTSINDWYELPFGIRDMRTTTGQLAVFY